MTAIGDGRPSEGGHPATREELVQVLTGLPNLDPIEQIRMLKNLGPVASSVFADEAARIMARLTARTNPERITQTELARRLGIHKNKVTVAVRRLERLRRQGNN